MGFEPGRLGKSESLGSSWTGFEVEAPHAGSFGGDAGLYTALSTACKIKQVIKHDFAYLFLVYLSFSVLFQILFSVLFSVLGETNSPSDKACVDSQNSTSQQNWERLRWPGNAIRYRGQQSFLTAWSQLQTRRLHFQYLSRTDCESYRLLLISLPSCCVSHVSTAQMMFTSRVYERWADCQDHRIKSLDLKSVPVMVMRHLTMSLSSHQMLCKGSGPLSSWAQNKFVILHYAFSDDGSVLPVYKRIPFPVDSLRATVCIHTTTLKQSKDNSNQSVITELAKWAWENGSESWKNTILVSQYQDKMIDPSHASQRAKSEVIWGVYSRDFFERPLHKHVRQTQWITFPTVVSSQHGDRTVIWRYVNLSVRASQSA